jgi:predicted metal-dependent peptidase
MIKKTTQDEQIISTSRLRIRIKSPFFATLALFAEFIANYGLETAATDGKTIFYNPDYLISLSTNQQDGLIIHEILHCALLHNIRRQHREAELWNIAADIVVNGLIAENNNYELPPSGIRHPEWENKSVEEIYELLLQQEKSQQFQLSIADLLTHPLPNNESNKGSKNQNKSVSKDQEITGSILSHQEANLRAYWKNALQQAVIVERTANQGKLPAGIERQIGELAQAQIDWRTSLWRYLVQTPTDFQGYDRRFISRGLYLDTLAGESVQVYVCIDTSGSISNKQMNLFCSELLGILRAYPHLQCQLYYADANIYGPYELKTNDPIPEPVGGGGTSFIPFFENVEKTRDLCLQGVCVYLTDGYGDFPRDKPSLPVLWVVTQGGLDSKKFPFGEVVKLY